MTKWHNWYASSQQGEEGRWVFSFFGPNLEQLPGNFTKNFWVQNDDILMTCLQIMNCFISNIIQIVPFYYIFKIFGWYFAEIRTLNILSKIVKLKGDLHFLKYNVSKISRIFRLGLRFCLKTTKFEDLIFVKIR